MRNSRFALIGILSLAIGLQANAQSLPIPSFGKAVALPQAHEQPNPAIDYKVVFDISEGAKTPSGVTPGLDRVARFVNLLAAGGVDVAKRQIVLVVHGTATNSVATDEAYGRRHDGQKNPNMSLVSALQAAGVSVRICGQAMTGQKLSQADLTHGVQVDVAALMTVTHLQFQGYALIAE